jgi:hypothetical protein
MSADSRTLTLLCLVLTSACAQATTGTRDLNSDGVVSILVENKTRENMIVYAARPGEQGVKLGSINSLDVRAFRLPLVSHAEMYLYLVPLTRESHVLNGYATVPQRAAELHDIFASVPFVAAGGSRVHLVVRDGQRLSAVTVR